MRFIWSIMVKRKAESSLDIGSGFEGYNFVDNLSEVPARLEQRAATNGPSGREHLGGVPVSHIDPSLATVAEEEGLATIFFLVLLTLAGYEALQANMSGKGSQGKRGPVNWEGRISPTG